MLGNDVIRVLLADDHPIVRYSLRLILEEDPQLTVVGEASNGKEALHLVQSLEPDVLLLDVDMPEMNGVDVALEMEFFETRTRTLVLSGHADGQYVDRFVSLGIEGYLLKEEPPNVIVEAVKGIHQGKSGWYSQDVVQQMATQVRRPKEDGLTPRQKEILEFVAKGKTHLEVGKRLGLSEKTVEKHLGDITKRMGVATTIEAVVEAMRKGWIEVEH